MGGNAKWFFSIRTTKDYYDSLPPQIRENLEISKAYRTDVDYSKYSEYVEQKKKTRYKEYKELEKIEHKINNLKENNI
jgi:3-hydroxy-3-methylglutaryl CoA synthase